MYSDTTIYKYFIIEYNIVSHHDKLYIDNMYKSHSNVSCSFNAFPESIVDEVRV